MGSKAAALGDLLTAGFPVPPGWCLTTAAFRDSGRALRVSGALAADLLATAQTLALPDNGTEVRWAARSSAAAEDLPNASFAGQYHSVIGISNFDDLAAAVEAVWRSYFTPSAAAMRASLGLAGDSGGMGVLLQPVILAEAAGVAFSLDPVNPRSGCVVINAAWGLGAGVVDGALPADTYHIRREDEVMVERRIVEKDGQFILGPQGGMVRAALPEAQRRAACLPEAWAKRIAQFAIAAEQHFGAPQDVEWAIAGGQVWILQSRPIASLVSAGSPDIRPADAKPPLDPWKTVCPLEVDSSLPAGFPPRSPAFATPGGLGYPAVSDAPRFWTNSRTDQYGKRPILPLDIDYWRLLESTRVETCLMIGAERNEDYRFINGRNYFTPAPLPISAADRRVRAQAFLDLQERATNEGRTAWDIWGPEIERANARLTAVDTAPLDGPALAGFLETAMAARSRHNMLHPLMWFKPRPSYFAAFTTLTGQSGAEAETAAYRLLEGAESPLNRLIDGLYDLAETARGIPPVADWMRAVLESNGDKIDGFPHSAPGAAAWMDRFQSYLAEFGDRSGTGWGSETLLSAPTWRDQPSLVVCLAAPFLDSAVERPCDQRERSRRGLDGEVEALCAQQPDPVIVADFRAQLETARRGQAVVEIHNHHIEQVGQGQLRRAVMAAAGWLQARGILARDEDVFWLAFDEILAALRATEPAETLPAALADKIAARKAEYQAWEALDPPLHLGVPPAALPARTDFTDDVTSSEPEQPGLVRGAPASPGRVRARARVVRTVDSLPPIEPGDILVAENAGPLWMPFFPILGGVVLETGSLGQHAASTAREYGIPAVTGAKRVTERIKDGDWLTVDGSAGTVVLDR